MGDNPQIVYKDCYPVLGLPIDVTDINLTLESGRVRPHRASYKGKPQGPPAKLITTRPIPDAMQSFGFKVVPPEGSTAGVPVAVAGQTMVDVQKLLTDIGTMVVRMELRIQNDMPSQLSSKFDLSIGGSSSSGIGSNPPEGSDALMEDALNTLAETLDFLGTGAIGTWMTDNFPEPIGRERIAQDLIDLADHISGFTLVYGNGTKTGEFKGLDRNKLLQYAETDVSSVGAAVIGTISRDPVKKNRWNISNGKDAIPITFDTNIAPSDIPAFASAGPVIVTGTVVRNKESQIIEVRNANGCYTFPTVKFHRIVTKDRDIVLLNPIVAMPSVDRNGNWHLSTDNLGMDVSKPTWDDCVVAYHEYFAFLWETYCESDDEFEGEEREISDFLRSLAPII